MRNETTRPLAHFNHFVLDINKLTVIMVLNNSILGSDAMKAITIRMPDELLDWLREKAARETIKYKKQVSMNTLAVELLTKAMQADRKKGGMP